MGTSKITTYEETIDVLRFIYKRSDRTGSWTVIRHLPDGTRTVGGESFASLAHARNWVHAKFENVKRRRQG